MKTAAIWILKGIAWLAALLVGMQLFETHGAIVWIALGLFFMWWDINQKFERLHDRVTLLAEAIDARTMHR